MTRADGLDDDDLTALMDAVHGPRTHRDCHVCETVTGMDLAQVYAEFAEIVRHSMRGVR